MKFKGEIMKGKLFCFFIFCLFLVLIIICFNHGVKTEIRAYILFEKASHLAREAKEVKDTSYSKALKLYEKALRTTERITTEYSSSRLAGRIVQNKAKIGPYTIKGLKEIIPRIEERAKMEESPLACALAITKTIWPGEEGKKDSALRNIAVSYAKVGEYDKALEVTTKIKDVFLNIMALCDIAVSYAEAGQREEASKILSQTLQLAKKTPFKLDAFSIIAGSYAKVGQYDKAFEVTTKIKKDRYLTAEKYKSEALCSIADNYAEAGQKEKASKILSQALQLAKRLKHYDLPCFVLRDISRVYAKIGQYDKAIEVADTIWGSTSPGFDSLYRIKALCDIAVSYAEAGQKEKASKILSQALQVAKAIEEDSSNDNALCDIAVSYAKVGQYDKALEVAKTIFYYHWKSKALCEIASCYADAGESDKALEILETAERFSRSYNPPPLTCYPSYYYVAVCYAKVGEYDKALETTERIEDRYFMCKALSDIAVSYAKTGMKVDEKAKNVLHSIVWSYVGH